MRLVTDNLVFVYSVEQASSLTLYIKGVFHVQEAVLSVLARLTVSSVITLNQP